MKDEFLNKFESKKTDLMNEYDEIKQSSKDKQEMITKIKKFSHPGAIFYFDSQNSCDPIIWRLLKPI